jgi:hypothetical protein
MSNIFSRLFGNSETVYKAVYEKPIKDCFQRKTSQYGKIGSWSNNQGFLSVNRANDTGRWTSKLKKVS